jgi:DNA replication factor GINS
MDIEKVEKVHSIGYRLKDAKFTVNQDFKVKTEGTQGEVNNVPQWVGKVLADNNLGTLDSPDMITELKQALSKEKMVGEYQISTLDPHFYIKLKRINERIRQR